MACFHLVCTVHYTKESRCVSKNNYSFPLIDILYTLEGISIKSYSHWCPRWKAFGDVCNFIVYYTTITLEKVSSKRNSNLWMLQFFLHQNPTLWAHRKGQTCWWKHKGLQSCTKNGSCQIWMCIFSGLPAMCHICNTLHRSVSALREKKHAVPCYGALWKVANGLICSFDSTSLSKGG